MVRALLVLLGLYLIAVGWWSAAHPVRVNDAAAGWLSTPSGRRTGGVMTGAVGLAFVVLGLIGAV